MCSPSSWCSCVGCVELLLRGLRCIAPPWTVLHCSFVGCVVLLPCGLYCIAPSWAVLCRYFVCSVEVLFDCSFVVLNPVLIRGCTVIHVLRVYSIVNAGGYHSHFLWEREFGFHAVQISR